MWYARKKSGAHARNLVCAHGDWLRAHQISDPLVRSQQIRTETGLELAFSAIASCSQVARCRPPLLPSTGRERAFRSISVGNRRPFRALNFPEPILLPSPATTVASARASRLHPTCCGSHGALLPSPARVTPRDRASALPRGPRMICTQITQRERPMCPTKSFLLPGHS